MASSLSSPWPDLNSPILSKINYGVPLVELFKWLDVRDTFLGMNGKEQDIAVALALARDCKHPDALWISSICKDVSTKERAVEAFRSVENDARALCFSWWLSKAEDLSFLLRAAEMGDALACSTLCTHVFSFNRKEAFRLAHLAAEQHERNGFRWLGFLLAEGAGCEKDIRLAEKNYLVAAELGDVAAADKLGRLMLKSEHCRWIWLARAALHRMPDSFLCCFSQEVERFYSSSGNAENVFLIGRVLRGKIDLKKKEIMGVNVDFEHRKRPALQAVSFFESQIEYARLAVDCWTILGMRLGMPKDLRIYIGKMIWVGRFEANYTASPAKKMGSNRPISMRRECTIQ